jgi:hypothetical protein
MKLTKVYICGKYSANNILDCLKNIGRGQKAAAKLFELGFAPFCPWHDKSYVTDNPEGSYTKTNFYTASLAWLEVSDCVYVISGAGDCGGVDAEIKHAESLYIPVFYSIDDLLKDMQ